MSRLAFHLLILLAAVGCDKPASSAPAPAVASAVSNAAPTTAPTAFGTIRGKVILSGWTPLPSGAQTVNCGDHKISVSNQSVVVKNNGLENVVIYLKNAPPS